MTEADEKFDIEAAPDRAERKALRRLYNSIGGAMTIQYILVYVIYFLFLLTLSPFISEQNDPETGADIVGWAELAAMYFSPALASAIVFFAFNAIKNVDVGAMLGTRGITPQLIGHCVLMTFAFHSVGMLLEYGVDIVLYSAGYEVTAFDYELAKDGASAAVDLISSVIAAPIAEELFFRGLVLKQTSRVSVRFGIVFSAVMFGLMHGNPYQLVMATVIGLYFGFITVKTDSLIPSMICHIAINSMMCISEMAGYFSDELGNAAFEAVFAAEIILGIIGIILYRKSGEKAVLPPYTKYHKKRTLPIILTSAWVIIISLIYIYDIINSVSPITDTVTSC